MYRRDYFLKMTQELAKMLAKIMGLKEAGEEHKAFEVIQKAYNDLFNIDRTYLLCIGPSEIVGKLKGENEFSNEHLEALASLLLEDAELSGGYERKDLLDKSLMILEYLNIDQKIYSFERENMIGRIKKMV